MTKCGIESIYYVKMQKNSKSLPYYDVIMYIDDVIMADTQVDVVTLNVITVYVDIGD